MPGAGLRQSQRSSGPCGHHVRFWPVRNRAGQIIRTIGEQAVFHHTEEGTTVEFHLTAEPSRTPVAAVAAVAEPGPGHADVTDITDSADDLFAAFEHKRMSGFRIYPGA